MRGDPATTIECVAASIICENLHKSYGSTKALDGLNLEVQPGEVMGFLGPNGSGKTTTIRILLGLLRHNGGRAEMLGRDPWSDAVELHKRVAYVAGDVSLWPSLSGGETIDLLGRLGSGIDPARRAEMIERFDLDPTKKGRTYSKGNRQKVALVAALAGNAELFVLDEPTSGLDPLMEAEFQKVAREMVAEGRTILLSSHILAEVESLCDRVTIIREGRTVETGTLVQLRHLTRTSVEATTREPIAPIAGLPGVVDFLAHSPSRASFGVENGQLAEVMAALAPLGIQAIESQPPTLEELFMRHYAVSHGPEQDGDRPANNNNNNNTTTAAAASGDRS